ncbi:hypothetical protein NHQ30_008048 [Ciborinia camelliae]|nr:hypothetical protein NHQ30_008048 [Ciborinia camelliae]
MSTSANLPAGFSITSINGVRCTAVPRSATTKPTDAVAVSSISSSTSISTSFSSTSTSKSTIQNPQPIVTSVTVIPVAAASTSVASTSAASTSADVAVGGPVIHSSSTTISVVESTTTTTTQPPPPHPPAPLAATSSLSQTTSTDLSTTASPSPASKGTTPTKSSSTFIAIAQSKPSTTASSTHATATNDPNVSHATPAAGMTASSTPVESPAASGISSSGRSMTAPIIGGVLGGIGFLALIVALLIFFYRRRRKSKRNSFLTPLTTGTRDQFYNIDKKGQGQGQYYNIYDDSVGSSGQGTNFKAQLGGAATTFGAGLAGIGSALKSHVHPGNKPTVDLNRGNSQFFEDPILYHRRNNSSASAHSLHYTAKDRAGDFTNRVKSIFWKPQKEERDPFMIARGMPEKQANFNTPQNSGDLIDMDDRNLLMKAERHRLSLSSNSGSGQMLGNLGLDFGIPQDPFADDVSKTANSSSDANMFADSNTWDSISRPDPAIPRTNTYISDVRRSRGESLDSTTRGHKNAPSSVYGPAAYRTPSISNVSRYPSSIAPSTESFRDTLYSNINNTRRVAGRSDPFDLERPELWLPILANSVPKQNNSALSERGSDLYPGPLMIPDSKAGQAPTMPTQRVMSNDTRIQSQGTYESKYSSRTSMGDWGDPGPDIGSGPSSLASQGFYGMNGNVDQQGDWRRNADGVSPMSATSSKGGVGKAW